jgi:hypothetical protein
MPAGRPTKYNEERAKPILERLRAGNTRKASVESIGIAYTTFLEWLENFPNFATSVAQAESEAEVRNATILAKAANGWETEETVTTTLPDGTVKTVVTKGREYDWRAAESWLKRRRRDEWGDNINLSRLSDEDLIALATGGLPGVGQARDSAERLSKPAPADSEPAT